jgi:hypothetical protein
MDDRQLTTDNRRPAYEAWVSVVHRPSSVPTKERPMNKPKPEYVPPQVTTYTDEEILEEMGPAQAVTGVVDP